MIKNIKKILNLLIGLKRRKRKNRLENVIFVGNIYLGKAKVGIVIHVGEK